MHKLHQQIIKQLQQISGMQQPDYEGFALRYIGTNKAWYHLKSDQNRKLSKNIFTINKLNNTDFADLINSLYTHGKSFEEISMAALLVGANQEFRSNFDLGLLDKWLNHVHGWAETDVLCQMAFTDVDLLGRWTEWQTLLLQLNQDENIHKRRASLVLLTKPVRLSADKRLSELAFANTESLKLEKHILLTKAVSWILRSLIKHHADEVSEYLDRNEDTLPKIALREARTKLLTGKKYINKSNI